MNDDGLGLGFIIATAIIVTIFVVGRAGAILGEGSAIEKGRNQGIIFCSEKPDQCKVEYTYLKLKENQK